MSMLYHDQTKIAGLVTCPKDTEENDFIAYKLCEFLEEIESYVNFVRGECQGKAECKQMNAGAAFKYLW